MRCAFVECRSADCLWLLCSFDQLQQVLDTCNGDQGLLDEARRLTQIERERGDALELECDKMKHTQRETLEESQALVRSLQVRQSVVMHSAVAVVVGGG